MGFFSDISGMLSGDYEGRYLAHVLAAGIQNDPQIAKCMNIPGFDKRSTEVDCEIEYSYKTGRRADLYLGYGTDLHLECLIEIKAEDGKSNGNVAQFKDYVSWSKKNANRSVVLLTKYPLTGELLTSVGQVRKSNSNIRTLTYSELHRNLSGLNSAIAGLVRDYLEDLGVVMYDITDDDAVAFVSFMTMNFLPVKAGWGRQSTSEKVTAGPEVFASLVSNWQLISRRIANDCNLKQLPSTRYIPSQFGSAAEDDTNPNVRNLNRRGKEGGAWTIFSQIKMATRLYVHFGVDYSITKGNKEQNAKPLKVQTFATVWIKGEAFSERRRKHSRGITDRIFQDETDLSIHMRNMIVEVLEEASELEEAKGHRPELKKLLKLFI